MGLFADPIKLGRPRKEVVFTADIDDPEVFQSALRTLRRDNENAQGEVFRRVFRRQRPDYRIQARLMSDTLKEKVESLKLIADEPLSFIFAQSWKMVSERIVTDGVDTLLLKSSPATLLGAAYKAAGGSDTDIIGITSVTVAYDPDGAGADLFGAGSYDAATRRVTLASGGGKPADTPLFVNWTYNGALVFIGDFTPATSGRDFTGSQGHVWSVNIPVRGA